jgi:hypothetical protein
MNPDSVVASVCGIPIAFRQVGGKSLHQLIAESGYWEMSGQLSAVSIESFLRQSPELVDDWLRYSEDKRTSGGWYFVDEGDRFVVGQIQGRQLIFDDRLVACAEFILREVMSVRP